MRLSKAILIFMLIAAIPACGDSNSTSTPTQPTPTPTPVPVQLAVFMDSATTFSTSDVRDVQEQIVRFDIASNSLIWVADGRSFSGYPVSGNFVRSDKNFQVRFGMKDGEHRAYFTETTSATICDIEIVSGQVLITGTNVPVPGT
jgi:hypothetical protein